MKKDTLTINGYKIRFNSAWGKNGVWQTSHDEIGVCGEFECLGEAINYCKNG